MDTEHTQEGGQHKKSDRDIMLPVSIIIAALLISGSWIYTTGLKNIPDLGANAGDTVKNTPNVVAMKAVTKEDHVRGDRNAPVTIVEFSDMECPFCKQFHATIGQIMKEYGNDGRVAWVYRHFPLDSLHPIKARTGAEATECVASLGGEEAFWKFLNRYFEITPSNNQVDLAILPTLAKETGVNETAFNECLTKKTFAERVEAQVQDAVAAGGEGTPYTVIIGRNGKRFPISGAFPYAQVKKIIDEALK